MKIRLEVHPKQNGGEYELPVVPYTLYYDDRQKFFKFLKNLKVQDGFSSNISQCVNLKDKIFWIKKS